MTIKVVRDIDGANQPLPAIVCHIETNTSKVWSAS